LESTGVAQVNDVAQHEQKAQDYLRSRQPDLALREFDIVVAAQPENLNAQANLGVLQYFAGATKAAIPHLRAALTMDPTQGKVQALLGFCEHRNGELVASQKDLSAALPHLQDVKVRKQAGLELVEVDTALSDLQAAAAVVGRMRDESPTDAEVLYAAFSVYTELSEEAMLDLSVAAPESAQMHQAIAHQLAMSNDKAGAIRNLKQALSADPNIPGAHDELAAALRSSSEPEQKHEAEQQFRLALKQNPGDDTAITGLADIAAENGKHDDAMGLYRQALQDQPSNFDAAIGLAHELTETGHPEDAVPLLLKVIKTDPTNVLAHYRLSAVYRRLHQPEDAKREIAEYERLKAMKDKLRSVYETLRTDRAHSDDVKP